MWVVLVTDMWMRLLVAIVFCPGKLGNCCCRLHQQNVRESVCQHSVGLVESAHHSVNVCEQWMLTADKCKKLTSLKLGVRTTW